GRSLMPTKTPTLPFRQLARNLFFSGASALLVFAASGTVQAAMQEEESSDGIFGGMFSTYGITIMLIGLLVALILYKRHVSKKEVEEMQPARTRKTRAESKSEPDEVVLPAQPTVAERPSPTETAQAVEKKTENEPSAFGAYRVDQEVSKLIVGKPHRMDVMASRASDDRRAIEAS